MFRKPLPSDKEVEALAKRLQGLWKSGQTIRPYLRKHVQVFQELLQDDWSWAGLALALTRAGITYQTEKPWSANTLMQAFSRAQSPLKGYARRSSKDGPLDPIIRGEPSRSTSNQAGSNQAEAETDEPEFKFARFIDWDERRRSEGGKSNQPTAPAPPSPHYIEIMEQLTGKKPA